MTNAKHTPLGLTEKEADEKRKIDRDAMAGKATTAQLVRGFVLLRKHRAAKARAAGHE